ncbi:MAG: hypothetical protein EXR48_00940 [Dehalococcoidia bacterium]|nr:hypothetical protein [Dehalococcoidia bacterium]
MHALRKPVVGLVAVLVVATGVLWPALATAHEGREVGEYEFTVGFLNEPVALSPTRGGGGELVA